MGWCRFFHEISYYFSSDGKLLTSPYVREHIFIRLWLPNGLHYATEVACRPPGQDLDSFNMDFNQLISSLTKKNNDVFIIVKFDIDLLKVHDHLLASNFFDIISSNYFILSITKPTRITSIIRTR